MSSQDTAGLSAKNPKATNELQFTFHALETGKKSSSKISYTLPLLIMVSLALFFFFSADSFGGPQAVFSLLPIWILVVAGGLVYSLKIASDAAKKRIQMQARVAAENGFTITQHVENQLPTSHLSLVGVSNIQQAFRGTIMNRKADVAAMSYVVSNGKHSRTEWLSTITVQLDDAFPFMQLDYIRNGFLDSERLPGRVDNEVEIKVEGDFNKYYAVKTIKGSERQVLQFLTPDIMSELVDLDCRCDIEIEGKTVRFIILGCDGLFVNQVQANAVLKVVQALVRHIDHVEKTWQASSTKSETAVMASAALAARKSAKTRVSQAMILSVGIFVILQVLPSRSGTFSSSSTFSVVFSVLVALLFSVYFAIKRR